MLEIYTNSGGHILTLEVHEILELHRILCDNYKFLPEMEPVSPAGIKNLDLLESAVNRQMVGSGEYYKYPDIYSNCATLVFGLVKNHSFHNGNKRIGFLAMLKHLYINGRVIKADVKHNEIYDLLREMANNNLRLHAFSYNQKFLKTFQRGLWNPDADIKYLAFWLRNHTEHKSTKIKLKTISLNDLQSILNMKNLTVNFDGRFLEVIRPVLRIQEIFGKKPYKKFYTIRKSKNVTLNIVEDIRRDFGLSFADGVDNSTFYNDDHLLNDEIISYKKIIYKLAKT